MKSIITILVLSATSFILSGQQRIDAKLFVSNEWREFVIFKPSGDIPTGGYPLVFMLHGTNQSGPQFYNISGWKEVAEHEKFIVVFPTALIYCTVNDGIVTKWSHGNTFAALCPGDTLRDDIPFFYRMIDTISSVISINSKKIFVCGFSSGGTMVPKLTIKMPGVFAAAACGSGNLDVLDSAAMNPKVPTWAIRGTHDQNFIDKSGRPCPFNDTALAWNMANLDNHLGSMGLSNVYNKDSVGFYINFNFTTPLPGESPAFFRWSIFYNLEHEFFNGKNYLTNLADPPIEAEFFWDFFKKSTLVSVENKTKLTSPFNIFPNPSRDFINIETPRNSDIKMDSYQVMDVFGRILCSEKVLEANSICLDKSRFGSGAFILRCRVDHQYYYTKIIFD